ncbi:MAG: bifunctional oligoribonuclease/PAP phosphatase NrnA [Candidatus Omnitrophica bacterium]|nr:bifunctional oligoribonuclease/PAP phosphatase NrnA [Candidatus Omnitrophota bacterium]
MKDIKFDCMAVLDCSDLERTGKVSNISLDRKIVLNIDHHISNRMFGNINWVEPYVSSTAEIIYKLYRKLHIPLNKDIATALYVGILTDTGSFRYANTKSLTHRVVSELLKYDLDIVRIYRNIYEDIPFDEMKLLIKILKGMKRDSSGKVIWFKLRRRLFKETTLSLDITEEVLKFARAVKDVELAILFKEDLKSKNKIRVNFRSKGKLDVNKIAASFGGGGHRQASGADIDGSLNTVTKKVLNRVYQELKRKI